MNVDTEVSCPHCGQSLVVNVKLDQQAIDAAVNRGVERFVEQLCTSMADQPKAA